MTVQEIYRIIDEIAPFDTQEGFDNSGLLVGSGAWEAHHVLFALDVTDRVLDEAEALGADLIVTHHPLMFHARKTLTEDDPEGRLLCRMIRSRIALISAHTNLDLAQGGTGDALAEALGLTHVVSDGYVRVGELPPTATVGDLIDLLPEALCTTVRAMGQFPREKHIRRLGLVTGSGGEFWPIARKMGAEAFLTGEIRHHEALDMVASGMLALECGHFATEEPGIFALADALQNRLNAVQYSVCVSKSAAGAYAVPANL